MDAGREKRVRTVQAVDRALAILEALAKNEGAISLTALSNKLGLNISTVHRLLNTLVVAGFAEQEPNQGRYCLGLKAFEVGNAVLFNLDIRSVARPYLRGLVEKCNETANLSVLDRWNVIYIDQVESTNIVKMFARPGTRGPSYCTGSGKAMLAFLSQAEINRFLKEVKLEKFTKNTITDPQRLKSELEQVRRQGYAVDVGELEEGVQCVAAPILNHEGRPVAAISISGPTSRITGFPASELVKMVVEAASQISMQLGYFQQFNKESR